jgi:lactate dehydrogenase-like 2-hydroxyacid dehydrogenase
MKPDVLIVGKMMPHVMEALETAYTTHKLYEAGDRDAFLAENGGKIRGIATSGHLGATPALMDACPNLEIISCYGVGVDAIDLDHARSKGVIVTNTPDVLNDDVANTAIMLLLATTRNLVAYDKYVRAGRWVKEGDPPLTQAIADQQIGIVGIGRIGQAIAEKLAVFDCRIAYHARNERSNLSYTYYADLVAMARDSLALIVITPGGADTHNLINRDVMDALGPEGHLINVARGSVVDEEALVAALTEGSLGFAGLDVFAKEPHVPEALLAMDNVVLQPHQGSATTRTRRAMGDLVVDNLAAHFDGKPALTPVV